MKDPPKTHGHPQTPPTHPVVYVNSEEGPDAGDILVIALSLE